MKIVMYIVILTLLLPLLLVNAGPHCDHLLMKCNQFKRECSPGRVTINNCCDLVGFPYNKAPDDVYQMRKCTTTCEKATPFTTITSDVYCNMHDNGGGWIVIQRNEVKSQINFNRNWSDYEEGFGNLHSEFWYGLKSIHCLTQNFPWEMKIVFKLKNDNWHGIHYDWFSVGSASEGYPLTVGGFTGGDDTDWFASHQLSGMKFSTPDNDNDRSSGNCAAKWKSGWWYNNCTDININTQSAYVGNYNNIVYIRMKIRPKDCLVY